MGLALVCTSCEDVLNALTIKEEVSIPPLSFIVERLHQKDAGADLLMDETFLVPMDSVLGTLNYSIADLADCLENMKVKSIFFQLVDTLGNNTFDFIDSARLTFSTPNVPEVTVAHIAAREERGTKSNVDLMLDLTDVTKLIQSKDSIRARIYGHVDMDRIPASVENVEVRVGGMMGMEMKPKK